jgi:hypothetical protein
LLAAAAVEQKTLPTMEKIDTSAADRDFSYNTHSVAARSQGGSSRLLENNGACINRLTDCWLAGETRQTAHAKYLVE